MNTANAIPPDERPLAGAGERVTFTGGAIREATTGKGRYDLLSPIALFRIARVMEKGATKYAARNWEVGIPISRFLDAALRHTLQHIEGYWDEDHLAQAAWNLMGAIHTEEMISRGVLPAELNDLPDYKPRFPEPSTPGANTKEAVVVQEPKPVVCSYCCESKKDWCKAVVKSAEEEPHELWICSRPKGHVGRHVACHSGGPYDNTRIHAKYIRSEPSGAPLCP